MAEAFDRSSALLGEGFGTIYQVPNEVNGGTALALSCLAAHVDLSGNPAELELQVVSAAGDVATQLICQDRIYRGMAVEVMPNRVTLLPGERLRGRCSPRGAIAITLSTLAPELIGNRRGIPSLEVYVRFPPPLTVGTDGNVVELDGAVPVEVFFPVPMVRTGFAVLPPSVDAEVGFPEPDVVIDGIVFGFVAIEPGVLSLELQAELPVISASDGGPQIAVPLLSFALTASAPAVANDVVIAVLPAGFDLAGEAPVIAGAVFEEGVYEAGVY